MRTRVDDVIAKIPTLHLTWRIQPVIDGTCSYNSETDLRSLVLFFIFVYIITSTPGASCRQFLINIGPICALKRR